MPLDVPKKEKSKPRKPEMVKGLPSLRAFCTLPSEELNVPAVLGSDLADKEAPVHPPSEDTK